MNNEIDKLLKTIKTLREPVGGCPWDLKQNVNTLAPFLLEEVCECLDGISNNDTENIVEELGDVTFIAFMMSYILEQEGKTTVSSIINDVNEKMIRRHPHVFSNDKSATTSDAVLEQWEDIKTNKEGRIKKGILDKIPKSFPPLEKAYEIQKKVEKVGFDWEDIEAIFSKITEETNEVREEIKGSNRDKLELEIGDLLFSVVNLSRFLKIDPARALSRTNKKFIHRFSYIENEMTDRDLKLCKDNFDIIFLYFLYTCLIFPFSKDTSEL